MLNSRRDKKKERGRESVARCGGELGRKEEIISRKSVARFSGELNRGPLSEQGVVAKDTKNKKEKPEEKAEREEPRGCLQPSFAARSSSIAMRQNTIESDQPGEEITNFANVFEKEKNSPGVER